MSPSVLVLCKDYLLEGVAGEHVRFDWQGVDARSATTDLVAEVKTVETGLVTFDLEFSMDGTDPAPIGGPSLPIVGRTVYVVSSSLTFPLVRLDLICGATPTRAVVSAYLIFRRR